MIGHCLSFQSYLLLLSICTLSSSHTKLLLDDNNICHSLLCFQLISMHFVCLISFHLFTLSRQTWDSCFPLTVYILFVTVSCLLHACGVQSQFSSWLIICIKLSHLHLNGVQEKYLIFKKWNKTKAKLAVLSMKDVTYYFSSLQMDNLWWWC